MNQFVLPRDPGDKFRFVPLQSALARRTLTSYGRDSNDLDTFYVVADHGEKTERLLWKAQAGLFVLREIGGPWRLARILNLLPASLLDRGYDFLARNRYRWFGKFDACLVPRPEIRWKFLEDG